MAKANNGARKSTASSTTVKKERQPKSFDGFIGSGSKLLAAIVSLSTKYDPVNTDITKVKAILIQAGIVAGNKLVLDAIVPEKEALIARQTAYDMMDSLTTNSLNSYKSAQGLSKAQSKISTNLAKGVHSVRIIPIKSTPIPPVTDDATTSDPLTSEAEVDALRQNSVSKQEFDSKAGNFLTYITYTTNQTNYDTNNPLLKAAALVAYHATLAGLNSTADEAIATSSIARAARNELFFNNVTGARFLYTQIKNYLKSFGIKSVEYKLVKSLPFPNLIPKDLRTPTTNY